MLIILIFVAISEVFIGWKELGKLKKICKKTTVTRKNGRRNACRAGNRNRDER